MTLQEINTLTGEVAEKLCDQLGLDTSGADDELRSRLRDYYVNGKIKLSPRQTEQKDVAPLAPLTSIPFYPQIFTLEQFSALAQKEQEFSVMLASQHTPDGLIIHKQEGVGLVVSAAEHNFKLSEWQAREADLMRVLSHAEESSRAHQDRVAELLQPSAAEQWNPDVEINHHKAQIALLVDVGNRLAKEAFERGIIDRVEEWDHATSSL